jgi:predicted protein tyrosine phosphatase
MTTKVCKHCVAYLSCILSQRICRVTQADIGSKPLLFFSSTVHADATLLVHAYTGISCSSCSSYSIIALLCAF